jgi:uncharacterized membrane protein YbhN (UPF0104 family)
VLDFLCFVFVSVSFFFFFLLPLLLLCLSLAPQSRFALKGRTDRQTRGSCFGCVVLLLRSKLTSVKSITHNTTTDWREGAVEELFLRHKAKRRKKKRRRKEGEGEQEEKEEQE